MKNILTFLGVIFLYLAAFSVPVPPPIQIGWLGLALIFTATLIGTFALGSTALLIALAVVVVLVLLYLARKNGKI